MLKITPLSRADHSILTYEEWKTPQSRLEDYKENGTSEFLGYVLEDGSIAIANRDYEVYKWKDVDGEIYESNSPLEVSPFYREGANDGFLARGITCVNLDESARTSHLQFYYSKNDNNLYEEDGTTCKTSTEEYFSDYLKRHKEIELFVKEEIGLIEYGETSLFGGRMLCARTFDGAGQQVLGILTDTYGLIDFFDRDLKSFHIKDKKISPYEYLEKNPNSLSIRDFVIAHSKDGNTQVNISLATSYQEARDIVSNITNNTKELDSIDEYLEAFEKQKEIDEISDEISFFQIPFSVANDKAHRDLILQNKDKREEVLLEQLAMEKPFWVENEALKGKLTPALEEFFILKNIQSDCDYMDVIMGDFDDFRRYYKHIFPEMHFPNEDSILPHDSQSIMFFNAANDYPVLDYDTNFILEKDKEKIGTINALPPSEPVYSGGIEVDVIDSLLYDKEIHGHSINEIANDAFFFELINEVAEEQRFIVEEAIKNNNLSNTQADALYQNISNYKKGESEQDFYSEIKKSLDTYYPADVYSSSYELNTLLKEERILEFLRSDITSENQTSKALEEFKNVVNNFTNEILENKEKDYKKNQRKV